MTFDPCVNHQISQKKLKKFEKEYHTLREQQEQQEAPIERYEVAPLLSMFTGSLVFKFSFKHSLGG